MYAIRSYYDFMEAFENSPASEAGLGRGDELREINSGSGWVPVPNLLATDPTLSNAFGPAEVGVQRRITSYNVCYTKLLRLLPPGRRFGNL